MINLENIKLALALATKAYQLSKDAAPYIKLAYEIQFKNKVLTSSEHKTMLEQETAWREEIDAVIAEDDKATD